MEPIEIGDQIICVGGSIGNVIGRVDEILTEDDFGNNMVILGITVTYAPPNSGYQIGNCTHVYLSYVRRYMP